ncbi:hypothetical protein [Salisediminibacterium selenitireducens]|uniref:Uncharacterized protein n=1 Tax=Bacillus selenitireducens (strain ATCC 700615 / DSM 15326 / MLS10) TaxID=439292 RepID=D6Y0I4_BACIE|nr:hypothetical protein [Salisediminibacterium selenitireducens]ADI00552.1 hypothetical protein Bsel_3070 [[Bacillus] selenitireducens MLS10]
MTPTDLQELMLSIKNRFEQSPDLTERSALSMIEEGIRQIQEEKETE